MRLPIQVQGIIFRKVNGEIQYLLLKRNPEREGFWQPVTGGVEQGETRVEALEREVLEETGIEHPVRIISDIYHFELAAPPHEPEYVYAVEVQPREKIEIDNQEHSEYRWCSLEEALRLLKWKEYKEALGILDAALSGEK